MRQALSAKESRTRRRPARFQLSAVHKNSLNRFVIAPTLPSPMILSSTLMNAGEARPSSRCKTFRRRHKCLRRQADDFH